jgi:hypothetical protein
MPTETDTPAPKSRRLANAPYFLASAGTMFLGVAAYCFVMAAVGYVFYNPLVLPESLAKVVRTFAGYGPESALEFVYILAWLVLAFVVAVVVLGGAAIGAYASGAMLRALAVSVLPSPPAEPEVDDAVGSGVFALAPAALIVLLTFAILPIQSSSPAGSEAILPEIQALPFPAYFSSLVDGTVAIFYCLFLLGAVIVIWSGLFKIARSGAIWPMPVGVLLAIIPTVILGLVVGNPALEYARERLGNFGSFFAVLGFYTVVLGFPMGWWLWGCQSTKEESADAPAEGDPQTADAQAGAPAASPASTSRKAKELIKEKARTVARRKRRPKRTP